MIHIHFVLNRYFPYNGGMEKSVARLTKSLSELVDINSHIHVMNYRKTEILKLKKIKVYSYAEQREHFLEPYLDSNVPDKDKIEERFRLDYLILRSNIKHFMDQYPEDHHILISFYITNSGFVAQHVANSLSIPHIASFRGSDHSQDTFNPYRFAAIKFVVQQANYIVTTNNEQQNLLRIWFNRTFKTSTIYNPINKFFLSSIWKKLDTKIISIFSDCGYSYKKGTHILIKSVIKLLEKNYDVRLTICGKTEEKLSEYWEKLKNTVQKEFPQKFVFKDVIDEKDILDEFSKSHLYCSATLGEGCSNSRLAALAYGIPIVSTNCGELSDLAQDIEHIKLCNPGNKIEFFKSLREFIDNYDKLKLDQEFIQDLRNKLTENNEKYSWEEIIRYILPRKSPLILNKQIRVLFFSHDGSGLGHLQRLSKIAKGLQGPCACLVVTGHNNASWIVPEECEYVHIPSLDSLLSNKAIYWGREPFLKLDNKQDILEYRRKMIHSSIESFDPDVIFVDYLPLGKNNELELIIKENRAKKYYIARGVLDNAGSVRDDILSGKGEEYLCKYYDRIIVGCDRKICDIVSEYNLSDVLEKKITYVGYIKEYISNAEIKLCRNERGLIKNDIWVVCSCGGGKFGENLIKQVLQIAEKNPKIKFDLIIGPRSGYEATFKTQPYIVIDNVRMHKSSVYLKYYHASADIVISPGGYNSLVEILQGKAVAITNPVQLSTNDEQYFHSEKLGMFCNIIISNVYSIGEAFKEALEVLGDSSRMQSDQRKDLNMNGVNNIREIIYKDMGYHNSDE